MKLVEILTDDSFMKHATGEFSVAIDHFTKTGNCMYRGHGGHRGFNQGQGYTGDSNDFLIDDPSAHESSNHRKSRGHMPKWFWPLVKNYGGGWDKVPDRNYSTFATSEANIAATTFGTLYLAFPQNKASIAYAKADWNYYPWSHAHRVLDIYGDGASSLIHTLYDWFLRITDVPSIKKDMRYHIEQKTIGKIWDDSDIGKVEELEKDFDSLFKDAFDFHKNGFELVTTGSAEWKTAITANSWTEFWTQDKMLLVKEEYLLKNYPDLVSPNYKSNYE